MNEILDVSPATPGILLAGGHEMHRIKPDELQISDGVVDPWILSIVQVIKSRVSRKRGIPSYTTLLDEANKYIRKHISGQVTAQFVNVPETGANDRDPQLIFDKGYIDPDTQRFLLPLTSLDSGSAVGELVRYPQDEL